MTSNFLRKKNDRPLAMSFSDKQELPKIKAFLEAHVKRMSRAEVVMRLRSHVPAEKRGSFDDYAVTASEADLREVLVTLFMPDPDYVSCSIGVSLGTQPTRRGPDYDRVMDPEVHYFPYNYTGKRKK